MLSPLSILDGITSSGIIISCTVIGIYSLYKAWELKAQLLLATSFCIILTGLFWLGPFLDFLSVLTTGRNLEPIFMYGFLSYSWIAPAAIFAVYLGAEILLPRKKWTIVGFYGIIGVIYLFLLFVDWNYAISFILEKPGEDLIDLSFNRSHALFFVITFYLVSNLVFIAIGFFLKGRQTKGPLKKKFYYVSIAYWILNITGAMDIILPVGPAIGIIRGFMMTYAIWMYFGLRPSTEEIEDQAPEILRLVDGLGIDYIKPNDLSEEEVAFYRDQTICLVCKKQLIGFSNIFICGDCGSFYCESCAKALMTLENMCWSCDNAMDKNRRITPLETDEDKEIVIEGKQR